MPRLLYIGCPKSSYEGDPYSLVSQWMRNQPPELAEWQLHVTSYAGDTSVDAADFASRVLQSNGPVLLLGPIQSNSRVQIQNRLLGRVPVLVEAISDLAQLTDAIRNATDAYLAGEPMVPRDLAVALMLMHKLNSSHMWAGNAKSYMWADDLPNGRGFDEHHACRLGLVISILLRGGILTRKTSQGKSKYALDPQKRSDIYETMRTRRFAAPIQNALSARWRP